MDTGLAVLSMVTCSDALDTGGRACRSTSASPTCICASGALGSQRHHCSGDHLVVVVTCFDETDSFSHATEILGLGLACAGAFSFSCRGGKAGHTAFPQVMDLGDFWTFAEGKMRVLLRREPHDVLSSLCSCPSRYGDSSPWFKQRNNPFLHASWLLEMSWSVELPLNMYNRWFGNGQLVDLWWVCLPCPHGGRLVHSRTPARHGKKLIRIE